MSVKLRLWTIGLLFLSLILVWGFRSERFPFAKPDPKSSAKKTPTSAELARDLMYLPITAQRKIYPYSVIPGGIASIEELKAAVATDITVAHHLQNFDLERARFDEVAAPRFVYVTYRKGSRIFWTTRKLKLASGEKLVTDGSRTLRGRCGNDVSDFAEEPTSDDEPTDAELDTPTPQLETQNRALLDPWGVYMANKDISTLNPSVGPPTGYSVPPFGPPVYIPTGGGTPPGPTPPGPTPPDPPISTPEPSSLILILLGAAGIGAERIRRLRK